MEGELRLPMQGSLTPSPTCMKIGAGKSFRKGSTYSLELQVEGRDQRKKSQEDFKDFQDTQDLIQVEKRVHKKSTYGICRWEGRAKESRFHKDTPD